MPGVPVLKPREVIAILKALGFYEVANAVRTNSSDMPMVAARQYRYMLTETYPRSFYVRSSRTLA
jgi:hypothetical protein